MTSTILIHCTKCNETKHPCCMVINRGKPTSKCIDCRKKEYYARRKWKTPKTHLKWNRDYGEKNRRLQQKQRYG